MKLAALLVVVAIGCSKKEEPQKVGPAPVTAPADEFGAGEAGDRKALLALPVIDGVGFLSGHYGTISNNPAMYADPERKVFVMLGNKGKLEVPFDKVDDALAAFEQFLLGHGYEANGKAAPDGRQRIVVDGKEMVVMTMAELLPEMPDEMKKRFTARQLQVIRNTTGTAGYELFSGHDKDYPPHPLMYAGARQVFVVGPETDKAFPIGQATAAFAEYRAMLQRTKIAP